MKRMTFSCLCTLFCCASSKNKGGIPYRELHDMETPHYQAALMQLFKTKFLEFHPHRNTEMESIAISIGKQTITLCFNAEANFNCQFTLVNLLSPTRDSLYTETLTIGDNSISFPAKHLYQSCWHQDATAMLSDEAPLHSQL